MTAALEQDRVDTPTPRAAPAPLRTAGAAYGGAILAVAVVALGAVAVRDTAVSLRWISGSRWLPTAFDWLAEPRQAPVITAAGAVGVVAGLACLLLAVTPRRRRAAPVVAHTPVFVEFDDLARIASAAAESVPGVLDARSSAGRRSVTVRCTLTGDASAAQRSRIADAVGRELAGLQNTPRITVRTHT